MRFPAFGVNKDLYQMAKSLSSILSQIERLQREAASIQSEVIDRIKKDIAKYGLTPEQLFGNPKSRGARTEKPVKKAAKVRTIKYADGAGNTWGGMGKRPAWLRKALEDGKSLEDFSVAAGKLKVTRGPAKAKQVQATKPSRAAGSRLAAKKRPAAKRVTRKSRVSEQAAAAE